MDDWLPEFHVSTHHARASSATPDELWAAAQEVRVRETRTLRPLIAWRLGRHAPAPDEPFSAVFRRHPFTLLAEESRVTVSGLAGPLWALNARYEAFADAEEFRSFSERGSCKVALRHEVREHERGSELISDARVWCTSRMAWLRFRPYWSVVAPFSRFVGAELLTAAVRRAERSSSAAR